MEKKKEVEKKIGPSYKVLLAEIKNGSVDQDQVQAIAVGLGVNTVYKAKLQKETELWRIFEYMVDTWYRQALYDKAVDGHAILIKILKSEPGLEYLVHDMEEAHHEDKK